MFRLLLLLLALALPVMTQAADAVAAGRMPTVEQADRALRMQAPVPQRKANPRPVLSGIYAPSDASAAFKPGAIVVRRHGLAAGDGDDLDDYDSGPVRSIADPFEPWNRFWFHFNDIFFTHIARPAYRGWEAVTHKDIRSGLGNFFHNVMFPVRFVNNLLQFRFREAGVEFGRFIINTTTSAGFSNVAKDKKTVVAVDPSGEDFGQTLGSWGIGHGVYLVWPFLGPSSLRDTVGRAGDLFADPFFYLSPWPIYYEPAPPWYAPASAKAFLHFNSLDAVFPLQDDLKGAAVDPYVAMREAWVKYRAIQVAR